MTRPADEFVASDAELVRRAQAGDGGAFGELVMRYQDRVHNAIGRMCRAREDAMDLTQTAFAKALEALPRFEARANFYTWLFRIAVNLTLSHRRVARRAPASLDADCDDRPAALAAASDEEGPAEQMERHEMLSRLEAALAALDAEFRVAVVLKDIEGMDYAAIADVLDVPIGTVKSRIHRGRSMLHELLVGEDATKRRAGGT
ncbi:ECF RNA polymerase sigma-E factor [Phycisphaerae bacterium RAS1]|nr:ECF RNA polymerase sigma-E factor [Phycisphaerae bacterium RAS1]